jgi:hypothetical protein
MANNATTFNAGTNLLTLKSTGLANNQSGRIGNLTGRTFTGTITWERYISGNTTWRQMSTPISGKTLADWEDPTDFPISGSFPGATGTAGGFTSIYSYDETKAAMYNDFDSGYVAPTNITNPLSPDAIDGKGYAVYVGQTGDMTPMNPFTISMSGNIISGTQAHILTNGNPGIGYATSETGYHLLANPYPSQIDIRVSGWSNIDGYYSLDPNTGNYDFYNLITQTPSGTATGIVAQGQAIFLYTSTDNNTISFTESMKTTAGGSENFLRQALPENRLVLNLSSAQSVFSDKTIVIFKTDADKRCVKRSGDARKINSPEKRAPQIYTRSVEGVKLLHNEYSDYQTAFVLPVEVVCPTAGEYQISGKGFNARGNCLVLVDKELNKTTDLTNDFSYTFKAKAGDRMINRFEIRYKVCDKSVVEQDRSMATATMRINNYVNQLGLEIVSDKVERGSVKVINLNGQVLYEEQQVSNLQEIKVPKTGLAPGLYFVKFEGDDIRLVERFVVN